MTQEQEKDFFKRIDQLTQNHKAQFGEMTVKQVLPHCTDQFRMALGEKLAEEYGKVDPKKIIEMAEKGENVPTPKGFGQKEGKGTPPIDFEVDRQQLKERITQFRSLPYDFKFHPHPYFGPFDKEKWSNMIIYHLNHHLGQFGV